MLHKPLSPSLNYTSRVRGSDGSGGIGGGVIVGVALISRLVILLVRRVVLGHRVWADLPFFLKTWASTKSYASASYLTDRSAPERPLNHTPGIFIQTRSSACSRAGYCTNVKSARLTGIAAACGALSTSCHSAAGRTGTPVSQLHNSSGLPVRAVCLLLTSLGRQSCYVY